MSIISELNISPEHRTHFTSIGKQKRIVKVNTSTIAYLKQYIIIEADIYWHIEISIDTATIMLNIDIELTDNTNSVLNYKDTALMKRRTLLQL